ncbi:MAG TPA: ABC transporter substrate-binding protein [Usitatibacter sp.]|nr:ABC transporter substrate-binding protein [Usitatibacter sp.]
MLRIVAVAVSLLLSACASAPRFPEVPAAVRSEFAPSGTLLVGVNFGNPVIMQKDPAGGAPRGVGADLARELARRLGVPVRYVTFDAAGKAADALKERAIDISFLAVDPVRAADIDFSAPYVDIEGTYLVRRDSPLRAIGDVDREGIRVAVGDKSAYDLYLTRALKNAKLVRAPTSNAAIEVFMAQKLEAAAGVKNPLVEAAAKDPSLRVIEGNFMVIGQASGIPRGRPAAAQYLRDFIEEAKASGFVARSLAASGITDAKVSAPAGSRR